jgi:hypothetical protein
LSAAVPPLVKVTQVGGLLVTVPQPVWYPIVVAVVVSATILKMAVKRTPNVGFRVKLGPPMLSSRESRFCACAAHAPFNGFPATQKALIVAPPNTLLERSTSKG